MIKNKKLFQIISTLLLLLWMILIFFFSAENANESTVTSNGVTAKIVSVVYPDFDELSDAKQQEIIKTVSGPIRKCAHFSIFFVLSILSLIYFASFGFFNLKIKKYSAPLFSIIYAITDEIHQYFVPGRSCQITDVFIDSSGVLLAFLIMVWLDKKFNFINKFSGDNDA